MPYDKTGCYYVRCDQTTKVFLRTKNRIGQSFILRDDLENAVIIKKDKRDYVASLINEWIEESNRSKMDDEKSSVRK